MHLRLFRSLVGPQAARCASRLAAYTSRLDRQYDGVVLNISQIESTQAVLDVCEEHSLRVICELDPVDQDDVGRLLDRLSNQLIHRESNALDLVVLRFSNDLPDVVSYLVHALPLTARFLESHPSIGSSHGKLNAHGKPLDQHVMGVCHDLSNFDIQQLSDVLDVLPPTRLALTSANLTSGGDEESSSSSAPSTRRDIGLSDELELLVQGSDLFYMTGADNLASVGAGTFWGEVWCAQQLDGATETYMACSVDGEGCEAEDDEAERVACQLRRSFDESLAWRNGAEDRHFAEVEAATEAIERGLGGYGASSPVATAAVSFGLDVDDDFLLESKIKNRWRVLALKFHPDVVGGSGKDFVVLKRHYRTLLEASRRRGTRS